MGRSGKMDLQPDSETPGNCYMCGEPVGEAGFLIPIGRGNRIICHTKCWEPAKGEPNDP